MAEPDSQDTKPVLIQHMELCFGTIQGGFTAPETGRGVDQVQFIECRGGLVQNASIVASLGLSRFSLASSTSKKQIRQELFFMAKEGQVPANAAAVLHQIADDHIRTNSAILRGDSIRKQGPLFEKKDFVALYSTLPIYYPEEMWICHVEQNDIVLCWLLPITETEWNFRMQKGWSSFEELVDAAQFDLFDLDRPSLV